MTTEEDFFIGPTEAIKRLRRLIVECETRMTFMRKARKILPEIPPEHRSTFIGAAVNIAYRHYGNKLQHKPVSLRVERAQPHPAWLRLP